MSRRRHVGFSQHCETLSEHVTRWAGRTITYVTALAIIVVWALLGPIFHYSDTWQLVINTSTTIITFLMVFLIQRSQNKDAVAMHLKLNELVAAVHGASNRLIEVEALTEKEMATLRRHYHELALLATREADLMQSHSIEEARVRHGVKAAHPRL